MAKRSAASVVDEVAKRFEETASEELVRSIRNSGAPVAQVIRDLAQHRNAGLRDWSLQVLAGLMHAGEVDHATGIEIVRDRALRDSDSDVRDEATHLFVKLAPHRGHELVPRLRTRLRSDEYFVAISAMWLLLELGDREAIPLIERYRDRVGTDVWQGKQAEIVLAVFDGSDQQIAARIASHDHDMMHVLCRAARVLRTPPLRAALRRCIDAEIDADCHRWCVDSLNEIEAAAASK